MISEAYIRIRFYLALGALIAVVPFFVNAQSLPCLEFKSMLTFVEKQHLRFEQIKDSEKREMVSAAIEKMPEILGIMGYPMMAAQFERISKEENFNSPEKNSNLTALCGALKSTLFRAAFLKSYIRNLDPYSDFFTSEELDVKTASLDGEFIGVGIGTEPEDNKLKVTEVVDGGPASGKLEVNDLIEKIDGHPVAGLNETEIRQRIRGPKNTSITFEGIRENDHFKVTLVRDQIRQKSIETAWSDRKFLTIRIHRFYRQTAVEVETVLKESGSKAKGIILDLRNNPGGLLQAARDLVDLFVPQGVVVYLRGREFQDQVWALKDGMSTKVPMVVLVNSETASAAEIVAGALQDYGRAIVVGQKTYGKGCVQNIYETQSAVGTFYRGGLKLTTLWYYLPSGRNVRSITPDVKIASNEAISPHPEMPYHGPEKIKIVREPKLFAKNKIDLKRSKNLAKKMHDYELVGQELLKGMQARR